MSSSSGGFWPGEGPADDDNVYEDIETTEPETVAQPEPEPATEPEPEIAAEWEPQPRTEPEVAAEPEPAAEPAAAAEPEADSDPGWHLPEHELAPESATLTHRPGEIEVPGGIAVIEGAPFGSGRSVGIVVARFNSEISNGLLESALEALAAAGVEQDRITVMPVPGAFELPIGAMALAKTRRYSCVIGLGCVIRGETSHFDFVATEAASGLQLAGLETGVPVAFGVLTVDTVEQAEERLGKGGEAARAALEMADIFSQVRNQVRTAN
jgi:6,7-dimethyl-8-ribityllumazine synthase